MLNSLDATVSVIDPQTWSERERISVGKEPHHLYLAPDEKTLIVANAAGNSLTLLDPKTAAMLRTLNQIADPYHLRFSPDMQWFVTAANRLNHVDVYRWHARRPRSHWSWSSALRPARRQATCGSTMRAKSPTSRCKTAMS